VSVDLKIIDRLLKLASVERSGSYKRGGGRGGGAGFPSGI
jgi:hypothetical protein